MSVPLEIQPKYDAKLRHTLLRSGFDKITKVTDTLQGSIWRAFQTLSGLQTVIKITNKYLHQNSIAFANDKVFHNVTENIIMEASILKLLSKQKKIANSVVKYHGFFESETDYFLIEEDAGQSLFDFVAKAHKLISCRHIDIAEWHKVIKIILKQMIESIQYIHSLNVCHFDVSLENFLINDVQIRYVEEEDDDDHKIQFIADDIQIKLADFGLSEAFSLKRRDCKSNKYVGKTVYRSPENVSKSHFDAKKNDIWAIGACLFMMTFGGIPWKKATETDEGFEYIMNGHILEVLNAWNKVNYANDELIDLIEAFFQYEKQRITLAEIMVHSWLKR